MPFFVFVCSVYVCVSTIKNTLSNVFWLWCFSKTIQLQFYDCFPIRNPSFHLLPSRFSLSLNFINLIGMCMCVFSLVFFLSQFSENLGSLIYFLSLILEILAIISSHVFYASFTLCSTSSTAIRCMLNYSVFFHRSWMPWIIFPFQTFSSLYFSLDNIF